MAGEKPETDAFLATLDARIAALQQLRASYVAAASVGAIGSVAGIEIGNVIVSGVGAAAGTSTIGQPAPPPQIADFTSPEALPSEPPNDQ